MPASFAASFAEAARLLEAFRQDSKTLSVLGTVADALVACFERGDKALVCGNGGSLADSVHFAEEWTGRFRQDREPYPVLALAEPSHVTCVANDYGFDHVFERGVRAFGKTGDLLFLLSTSGNSRNLVLAAEAARSAGLTTVGFLGRGGGDVAPLCDLVVMAPGETSDRIQELHMLALHTLIEVVEERLAA
ncbi:MAG: SIS domain-containing protein [Armatimonadetes bacterium]|nr:SIS domain-containing protein [Armatimonadota bacterium]